MIAEYIYLSFAAHKTHSIIRMIGINYKNHNANSDEMLHFISAYFVLFVLSLLAFIRKTLSAAEQQCFTTNQSLQRAAWSAGRF